MEQLDYFQLSSHVRDALVVAKLLHNDTLHDELLLFQLLLDGSGAVGTDSLEHTIAITH